MVDWTAIQGTIDACDSRTERLTAQRDALLLENASLKTAIRRAYQNASSHEWAGVIAVLREYVIQQPALTGEPSPG